MAVEKQGCAVSMNRGDIWPGTVLIKIKTVVWWLRLNCEEKEPRKNDQRKL